MSEERDALAEKILAKFLHSSPLRDELETELERDARDAADVCLAELSQLRSRLEYAENVCLMLGWSGAMDSQRGKATTQLWMEWARVVGNEFTDPDQHADLIAREDALAAERDRIRARTLASFPSTEKADTDQ